MLKPIEPASTATIVYPGDPAFVPETDKDKAEAFAQRTAAGDHAAWREMLTVRDGQAPTEFVIGVVPAAELTRLEDEAKLGRADERTRTLAWGCLLAGLVDVKNWPGEIERDSKGRPTRAWIERSFVRGLRQVGIYVGRVIWSWNQLTDSDARN
jgi:hypothetical protein